MSDAVAAFSDPAAVAHYTDGPRRMVPGLSALHRMTMLLLAERVPSDGRLLALGAGGGMDLAVFAEANAGWSFDGVDPSAAMLALARTTLSPFAERVTLHEGYIDIAPVGPFDGATCLLTFHFVSRAERLRIAMEIRRRLKPGAPLVVAHFSMPSDPIWFARYAAFAIDSGLDPAKAKNAREAIAKHLHILTPEDDEAVLREAGFLDISLFYAGFTFRGWVAYA